MKSVSVILAAGGSGKRMQSGVPKQLLELRGMPVLEICIRKFVNIAEVSEIVIAAPESLLEPIRELCSRYSDQKPVKAVAGGAERQDSVWNALNALTLDSDAVCIHDAVRPFFSPDLLRDGLNMPDDCDGVVAAVPAVHTMKRVIGGTVRESLPREEVYQIHTPQIFRRSQYRKASEAMIRDGLTVTDDAMIMEHAGYHIQIIPDSHSNIKLTYPGDYILAEQLMAAEDGII